MGTLSLYPGSACGSRWPGWSALFSTCGAQGVSGQSLGRAKAVPWVRSHPRGAPPNPVSGVCDLWPLMEVIWPQAGSVPGMFSPGEPRPGKLLCPRRLIPQGVLATRRQQPGSTSQLRYPGEQFQEAACPGGLNPLCTHTLSGILCPVSWGQPWICPWGTLRGEGSSKPACVPEPGGSHPDGWPISHSSPQVSGPSQQLVPSVHLLVLPSVQPCPCSQPDLWPGSGFCAQSLRVASLCLGHPRPGQACDAGCNLERHLARALGPQGCRHRAAWSLLPTSAAPAHPSHPDPSEPPRGEPGAGGPGCWAPHVGLLPLSLLERPGPHPAHTQQLLQADPLRTPCGLQTVPCPPSCWAPRPPLLRCPQGSCLGVGSAGPAPASQTQRPHHAPRSHRPGCRVACGGWCPAYSKDVTLWAGRCLISYSPASGWDAPDTLTPGGACRDCLPLPFAPGSWQMSPNL